MPRKAEEASPASSTEDQNAAAAAPVVAVDIVKEPDANAAESSAADTTDAKQQPQSLLDVVKNAVEPVDKQAAEASSTAVGDDQEKPAGEAEAAKAEEVKPKDDADVPFHDHPRWKEVLRERDEFKQDALRARNIDAFLAESNVPAERAAEALGVVAQLHSGDPAKLKNARDFLQGQLDALDQAIGVKLPDDLQARFDDGSLDGETAKELAQARATTRLREQHDKQQSERSETAKAAEDARTLSTSMATAVQGWESEIRKSDPDYAKKEDLVSSTALAIIHREGAPKNAEEAIALSKRAYEQVDRAFKAALPKPRPVDTTTPSGSSASATAAPGNLRAAIEAAVAG